MKPRPPWIAKPAEPSSPDEGARWAASLTVEQRMQHFVEACELARVLLEARPDRDAVLARREPMSEASAQRWAALVTAARRARAREA